MVRDSDGVKAGSSRRQLTGAAVRRRCRGGVKAGFSRRQLTGAAVRRRCRDGVEAGFGRHQGAGSIPASDSSGSITA